jgi:hypothetical protein
MATRMPARDTVRFAVFTSQGLLTESTFADICYISKAGDQHDDQSWGNPDDMVDEGSANLCLSWPSLMICFFQQPVALQLRHGEWQPVRRPLYLLLLQVECLLRGGRGRHVA